MVVKSCYPDIDIPDNISVGQYWLDSCDKFSDKIYLIDPYTNKEITYGEFASQVRCLADSLQKRGVKSGDRIFMLAPNDVLYPVCACATVYIKAIFTTCNPVYTTREILSQLQDGEATYMITFNEALPKVKDALEDYHNIKEIYVIEDEAAEGSTSLYDLIKEGDPTFTCDQTFDVKNTVAFLPYSSGTSGKSKGVMCTHYNLFANVYQTIDIGMDMADHEIYINFLPFYHIYGLWFFLVRTPFYGHTTVIMKKFDLDAYLGGAEKYKATSLYMVPPVALALARSPVVKKYDLSSVCQFVSAAAPLDTNLEEGVISNTGVQVVRQGYGMTELSPTCTFAPGKGFRPGSVGKVIRNAEIKVVNSVSGAECGVGEDGELWFRGPNVMRGYWNLPQTTQDTVDQNGYLHTGDIGHYDDDEQFFIVDRIKELIKYKGLQVAPAELEGLLLKHEAVADSCVVGIKDIAGDELPKAFVVKKKDATVTGKELQDFIAEMVSPHKKLRGGIEFIDTIPKSAAGKILRRVLKDQANSKQG